LGHSLIQIGGLDRRKGTAPSSSVLARDSQRQFGSGCVAGCRVFSCFEVFARNTLQSSTDLISPVHQDLGNLGPRLMIL
jgi:hypothetical protein